MKQSKRIFTVIVSFIALAILALGIFLYIKSTKISIFQQTASVSASESAPSVSRISITSSTAVQTTAEINPNEDLLLLVNYNHPVPEAYKTKLVSTEFNQKIDSRAANDLKQLLNACRKAGCKPLPCSGYRSKKEQAKLLSQKVLEYKNRGFSAKEAQKQARKWIAEPGKSEHHTGLAMDIIDLDYQILDEKQKNTKTQRWLMKHCWEYGFILRYPEEKKAITHINSESWHYRYVGKENAKKIYQSGLCLEEYVQKMQAFKN